MKLGHKIFFISSNLLIFLLFWMACITPTEPSFSATFLDTNVQVIGTSVEGTPMRLFVKAQGTTPILYQWYKNDSAIGTATGDTLLFSSLHINDNGIYSCRISNSWGEAISSGYVLQVKTPPSITLIPNQTICKGGTFSAIKLDNFVVDNDHMLDKISWTSSGYENTIVSISDNRIVTINVVDPNWIGTEKGQFMATDPDELKDSLEVSFTVTDGNPPILSIIPDQAIAKGEAFSTILLDHYVEDADNADEEIIWNTSATTFLTITINTDRQALIAINDTNWIGSETVYFTATDPIGLNNTTIVTFTVNIGSVPVIDDIPDQTIGKGGTFTTIGLDDYVEDADNADHELIWTTTTPTDLSITIDTNRIASIAVIDSNWMGSESINFTVTDPDGQSDTNYVTFTVNEGTAPPVISAIQNQTVKIGEPFSLINLDEIVHDSDNHDSTILWTTSTPVNLTVTIDINRQATITVKDPIWLGSDTIVFIATDPGGLADSASGIFTVTDNFPPMVSDIPNDTVLEGAPFKTITLDDFVTDNDNPDDQITWTASSSTILTVTINSDRIATIVANDSEWNGTEAVTFTATDPTNLSNSDIVHFVVTPVNDPPVVKPIPDNTIKEGGQFENINLDDFVTDADNPDEEITWTTSPATNLNITISADRKAIISVKDKEWNGSEIITFAASDPRGLFDSCQTKFTVTGEDDPPIVADIADQTVAEGTGFTILNLDDFVHDSDNTDDQITWSASPTSFIAVNINKDRQATIIANDNNWNGNETVTFTATDPTGLSNSDNVVFTVTPVNDTPVVASIPDETVKEGEPFTIIRLDDFVSDIDNSTAEITWAASAAVNLTISISTDHKASIVVKDQEWNGNESVVFTATDPGGLADSCLVTFTVTGEADPPIVADIKDQTIAEGASFTVINLDDFVHDSDNTDDQITWEVSPTTNITVTISNDRKASIAVLDPEWSGNETVTFTATDPTNLANSDNAIFTVTPVNDAPVVTKIVDETVKEGEPFSNITLDDFVEDIDNSDDEITWTASPTTNIVISISANNVVTITVNDPEWNGSETVVFTATDPGGLVDTCHTIFTVIGEADPPIVSDMDDQTIDEGGTFTIINLDDFVADADHPDDQITWEASSTSNINVSISPDRKATISIVDGEWNGMETVTLTATDPTNLSNSDNVTFSVNPVNDPPFFTKGADETVNEDCGPQSVIGWATSIGAGPPNENSQVLTFNVRNDNGSLFSSEPSISSNGTLSYTPAENAFGPATITVELVDDGGTANGGDDTSPSQTFTITVNPVNDAPSFTKGDDQIVNEDCGPRTVNAWATNLSFGPVNENGQTYEFTVTNDNSLLFATEPSVGATGTLTYTPAADAYGSATITVFLKDNGGTANGGDDTSPSQTFTITVNSVNDKPSFTKGDDLVVDEDCGLQTVSAWATDISEGPANESDQKLTFFVSNNNNSLFSSQPSINSSGTLTYTPGAEKSGSATVSVYLSDDGGVANGGENNSDTQTFRIRVRAVNDPPRIISTAETNAKEDEQYTYDPDAEDPEQDVLTWSLSLFPDGMSIDRNTGLITWTPREGDLAADVVVKVSDGEDYDEQSYTITVRPVNDPPTIITTPPYTGEEDKLYTYNPRATDPETGILVWSLPVKPTDMTINSSTGAISWTPLEGVLSANVTVRVTDNGSPNEHDDQTYEIIVTPVNDPPEFSHIPNKTITSGEQFPDLDLKNYASDPDSPTLTYSWIEISGDGVPSLNDFDEVNGIAKFWYKMGMVGSHTFRFFAQDTDGERAHSNDVTYTVNPPK